MQNVKYPSNFFARPFADTGTKQIIPDTTLASGRASLANGFPAETQLPLNMGGVAPNRTDFNGALYMLSAFAFWQQSGGQWTWQNDLNYAAPSMVHYNGKLWWCVAGSGPQTSAGAKTPGSDNAYWLDFLAALANMSGGSSVLGNPVGTVIMYHGTTAPQGYLACNGATFSASTYPRLYTVLGKNTTPDMRGQFVRGYDTRNSVDPQGSTRAVGSVQTDAGRNITGRIAQTSSIAGAQAFGEEMTISEGVLFSTLGNRYPTRDADWIGTHTTAVAIHIDASRAWTAAHTANEFRPTNVNLLYCIKHD